MQTSNFRRALAGLCLTVLLVACTGSAGNPYSSLKDAPLVPARLHSVTLLTDDAAYAQTLQGEGFTAITFPTNYPVSDGVQANIWSVPVPAVAGAAHLKAPGAGAPDVRVLVTEHSARSQQADSATEKAFFRNVLGSDMPALPAGIQITDAVRVQVWTFVVPSVLDANKRLRANGIPVVFDPVAITTGYLGDHKTMAIRAPDGTIVELVETASQ